MILKPKSYDLTCYHDISYTTHQQDISQCFPKTYQLTISALHLNNSQLIKEKVYIITVKNIPLRGTDALIFWGFMFGSVGICLICCCLEEQKVLCFRERTQVSQASVSEGKDPRTQIHNFLLQYRATPHATTEKAPSEMLFNRRIKTKLPHHFSQVETEEQLNTRVLHDQKKLRQKQYFDSNKKAKEKNIQVGDKVLIRQQKTRARDKNQLKKVPERPKALVPSWEKKRKPKISNYAEFDIEIDSDVRYLLPPAEFPEGPA